MLYNLKEMSGFKSMFLFAEFNSNLGSKDRQATLAKVNNHPGLRNFISKTADIHTDRYAGVGIESQLKTTEPKHAYKDTNNNSLNWKGFVIFC